MKNKQGKLDVLLDTSFILPTLGIDTGREVTKGLKALAGIEADIYYSTFSILESLWITARFTQSADFDAEHFRSGLRSIIESRTYAKIQEDSDIFNDALRLQILGHRDMIDNILYASSVHLNLKLLTLDVELRNFVKDNKLNDTLIFPDEMNRTG